MACCPPNIASESAFSRGVGSYIGPYDAEAVMFLICAGNGLAPTVDARCRSWDNDHGGL